MDFEKIKYSKCPCCKKHGITSFMKIGRQHNWVVACKYCQKKFSVNRALSVCVYIITAVVVGIVGNCFNRFVYNLPSWVWIVLIFMLLGLFEYFAPLEEIND